jgi:hypothetical protein
LYGFLFLLTAGAALNPEVPIAGRLACATIAAGIAYMGRIAWRAGVQVDEEQVTVRKWSGRNVAVPWSEVQGFALLSNGKGGAWVSVLTTDGRRLKTQGLAVNSKRSEWGQSVVAQLEATRPKA